MRQLTREHQAVSNFKTAIAQLRPIVEDDEAIQYPRFYDSYEGAISNFILSELYIRQGERCDVLDVFPDLKNFSLDYGNSLNTQGIGYLETAKAFLVDFKNSLGTQPDTDADFQTELNAYFENIKETLSQVEIKADDAEAYSEKFRDVLDSLAIGNNGLDLLDYIIASVQDLIDARGTSSRGAALVSVTGAALLLIPPVWKVAAAAVLLGLGAWVVYKCYYSPWRCSKREQAIYNTILAFAMIALGACE